MLFKYFMKPSLMWMFHMNAGLACEHLEFTLWPQLTAWSTITRYLVAYMSNSRLLIVSWFIADFSSVEASWANVLCFAQLLTSGVAPTVFTSTYVYVGAWFSNECSISKTHCSYDKPWQLMSYHAIFMKKQVRTHLFWQQLRWSSHDSRAHKSSSSFHRRIQTEY